MKVVVVGSGGREHALCDTLAKEGHRVVATPGNPGIAECAEIAAGPAESLDADLFVVGPEAPLVDGLADRLRAQGKLVFGPGRDGAMLEGSKHFMKRVAAEAKLPTAAFAAFDETAAAFEYLESMTAPYVIKTDGLAAGKGVLVTTDLDEAKADVRAKLSGSAFGEAGRRVVIEEGMSGLEVSLLAVVDGQRAVALRPAADHKRLLDADRGPNTGGMGAYSPVPFFGPELERRAMAEIVEPAVARLAEMGVDYRGVLYAGLMLTQDGPKLVEFNVRFGDPEAQVVLPALGPGLGEFLAQAAAGHVGEPPAIRHGAAATATVVMAAPGYPESPRTGGVITGLDAAGAMPEVKVFHAGTRRGEGGEMLVAGGRVLSVTGFAQSMPDALTRAYAAIAEIHFEGAQFRSDIGASALAGHHPTEGS